MMNKKDYKEYLKSTRWRNRAKHIKIVRGFTCEICDNHLLLEVVELIMNNKRPSRKIPEVARFCERIIEFEGKQEKLIQAHHLSYKNIGNERDEDLACVCHPCHVLLTECAKNKNIKESWNETFKKVNLIIKRFNNQPDGEREFTRFITFEKSKTDFDLEMDELDNDYYSFQKEYYEIMDEFE